MAVGLEELEARVGYQFRDRDLLNRALTHKSRAFETTNGSGGRAADNEQLEFLGDAVLGFLVSEMLVQRHPDFPEGRLSKVKAYLVSASHLHQVAQRIELGDFLHLGRGEELSGGRSKRALLANALEALIAAHYLDGGIECCRRFVQHFVVGDFDGSRREDESLVVDYKSALQEAALSHGLPMPRYLLVAETGPEHRKTFLVEVRVGQELAERAEGTSKKAAGQKAAQLVLAQMLSQQELEAGAPNPP